MESIIDKISEHSPFFAILLIVICVLWAALQKAYTRSISVERENGLRFKQQFDQMALILDKNSQGYYALASAISDMHRTSESSQALLVTKLEYNHREILRLLEDAKLRSTGHGN